MEGSDHEPLSLPCSAPEAKIGLPVMVQLHLVDAGLKSNPRPRADFYRQYSITPERRTPPEERVPMPAYSPGKHLRMCRDWAAKVAEGLEKFHAGRVMLRIEEAEQPGDLEQDPEYWDSKVDRWQDLGTELFLEWQKRKLQELNGEAEEGYAQAMLLSPLQPPSHQPSDHSLPETTRDSKPTTADGEESQEINERLSQTPATPRRGPLKSTVKQTHDDFPTDRKGQKRKSDDAEDHEESLDQSNRIKRRLRGTATVRPKQVPVLTTESAKAPERGILGDLKTKAKGTLKVPKSLSPKARPGQPALPWELRPRKITSYRETGSGTTTRKGDRHGKLKTHQSISRRHAKRSHGRDI